MLNTVLRPIGTGWTRGKERKKQEEEKQQEQLGLEFGDHRVDLCANFPTNTQPIRHGLLRSDFPVDQEFG